ncbi:alcohol oxidase, partial [Punctularia strigosozonata HHB-11173 SS5]|uniref:alcohol oxidase n=1 Tax=Punctularia strigosozonata (strain HHB-11173) TaxID=741275 RepID=UPI000441721B
TAGLCLAARLSDDPKNTVLVLEAGEANLSDPNILRPASFGSHFGNPSYDWSHQTTKQKYCDGKSYIWNRGKGLGGSSGINFMCWVKPPASDINGNADIERLGNPGWNWDNYDKYTARTESFVAPDPEKQKAHNLELRAWKGGSGDSLSNSDFQYQPSETSLSVMQTLINCGIPIAPDPVSKRFPAGVYFAPNTVDPKTHTRTYSVTAFYTPNAHRENITVLCGAQVRKVLTASSADGLLVAESVEFDSGGKVHAVNAAREIILSAGALKTPQILEMSGIGLKSVLNDINIPVKLDLPVGENVQEHIYVGISWELREDVSFDTLDILQDSEVASKHLELHVAGEGIFTTGIVGFAFAGLDKVSGRAPEIIAHARKVMEDRSQLSPGLVDQYEIQLERLEGGAPGCEIISIPGFMSGPNMPEKGKKYLTVLAASNYCLSRGTIHSTTSDPSVDPAYDPHYMQREWSDAHILLDTVKFVRNMSNVAPFKDMIVKEVNPGADIKDDAALDGWMKQTMGTTFHTCGSASMLPKDKGGVVDPDLKVYGTTNLRVVDLSILPLHFAAHPLASVYAIAEQGKSFAQHVSGSALIVLFQRRTKSRKQLNPVLLDSRRDPEGRFSSKCLAGNKRPGRK